MSDHTRRMSDHTVSDPTATAFPPDATASPPDAAAPPPDVSLLLRAHAERRWLSREVIPVVRQIETCEGLPDEQLPAALAYLEVIWAESVARARDTDAERRRLDDRAIPEQPLLARARRYHAVVRDLREIVARRVARLLSPSPDGHPARQGLLQGLT